MKMNLKKEEVFIFNEEERPSFKKYNQIKEESLSVTEDLLRRKDCLLNVIKKDVLFEVKGKGKEREREKRKSQFGMFVDREYYEVDLNKKE